MEFSNLWKYCYRFTQAFFHIVQNFVPFCYRQSPSRCIICQCVCIHIRQMRKNPIYCTVIWSQPRKNFARTCYLRLIMAGGRRKNYLPSWDKECEARYHSFLLAPMGTYSERDASSLLSRLKKQRWAKLSIPSTSRSWTSSLWSTIIKLTGRSGRSSRLCPVSANSIAPQLVKNGAHKTSSRESTRFTRPMEGPNICGKQYLWPF